MNILFTSIGRRTYIVDYFKKTLNNTGKVFVANSEYTYAFKKADGYLITPLIYDKDYIEQLLYFCKNNKIDCIISLFDIDLYKLAQHKELFKKNHIELLVSDKNVIEICNDKYKTYKFCIENNFYTPKSYINIDSALNDLNCHKISFPVVVKPRWGMGSIGVIVASSFEELSLCVNNVKQKIQDTYLKYESAFDIEHSVLIQELIKGIEYNIDIINDLHGNYILSSPKKKLLMRAGETDIAEIVNNPNLLKLGKNISVKLKHILNLDLDCIFYNNRYYVIDMNCRIGGGFPFSYLCGVDLPSQINKWFDGGDTDFELLRVKQYKTLCKEIVPVILK